MQSGSIVEKKGSGRCQKSNENPSKHLIHFVEHASECHIIKRFFKAPFCLAIPLLTSFEKITAGHRY